MFEEIMVQKFSKLMKDTSLKIQETHKISVGIKLKKKLFQACHNHSEEKQIQRQKFTVRIM